MPFPTTIENKVLDHLLKGTSFSGPSQLFVSLHSADPGETGAYEISGGSYARKSVAFTSAASKATSNTADVSFPGMPAVTVTHIGLWDATSSGVFWCSGALSPSKTLAAGDTFLISAGDLDITRS